MAGDSHGPKVTLQSLEHDPLFRSSSLCTPVCCGGEGVGMSPANFLNSLAFIARSSKILTQGLGWTPPDAGWLTNDRFTVALAVLQSTGQCTGDTGVWPHHGHHVMSVWPGLPWPAACGQSSEHSARCCVCVCVRESERASHSPSAGLGSSLPGAGHRRAGRS